MGTEALPWAVCVPVLTQGTGTPALAHHKHAAMANKVSRPCQVLICEGKKTPASSYIGINRVQLSICATLKLFFLAQDTNLCHPTLPTRLLPFGSYI